MPDKMVCILTFYSDGGIGSVTDCFCRRLTELGFKIDVYYLSKPWHSQARVNTELSNVTYKKLTYLPFLFIPQINYFIPGMFMGRLLNKYSLFLSISGYLQISLPFVINRKPHIAYVATPYFQERISGLNLRKISLRALGIITELIIFKLPCELLERVLYKSKYNKVLLFDSEYTKTLLINKYGQRENLIVLNPPMDKGIFKPKVLSSQIGSERYIFSCGRFSDERKNLDLLLGAFNYLKSKNSSYTDLKLKIAGFAPVKKEVFIEKLSLDKSVEFLGYVDEIQKVQYYQGASVFVLSSKQEGLGIVLLEAMACGVPVVSTRCGGPESFIQDGFNGVLTDINKESLAEGIEKVLKDNNFALNLREQGLKTIKDKFSWRGASDVINFALGAVE